MKGESCIHNLYLKSGTFLKQNSPTILTCLGAVGVVATSILVAKASVKASKKLEAATEEKGDTLTKLEMVNAALPSYIPAIVSGAATITCIFGANTLNKKHQASLVSAYGVLDQTYKEYREKVKELYGEDANDKVNESFAKENYPRRS